MPQRAMRLEVRWMSSRPSSVMEPLRLASRPMIARMVVVLPAPLRPRSVTTSPAFTSKVMPCRMWLSPYQACTSPTASWASGMAGPHISFDDLRIGGDLTVGSLGQHLAAGEHRDAIGKVGDHR